MRLFLAIGQIAVTLAPALVLLTAMAFDGEAHRGHGSDFDKFFFSLAWALFVVVVAAGIWLTWSLPRTVPVFSLRFWAPSTLGVVAAGAAFALLLLSQLHAASALYEAEKAKVAEMRAELRAGDAHRACELVALSTRTNLTGTTLTAAREDDVRACLAHTRTLAPEQRRASLDSAFLLAGTFLAIDAQKAGRPVADWSRSFPPFPVSTQADIVRAYFSARLALPKIAPTDVGELSELLANVHRLQDWDASAQQAFADEVRPQLLARVERALRAMPDPDTALLLRRLRSALLAFPEDAPADAAD